MAALSCDVRLCFAKSAWFARDFPVALNPNAYVEINPRENASSILCSLRRFDKSICDVTSSFGNTGE